MSDSTKQTELGSQQSSKEPLEFFGRPPLNTFDDIAGMKEIKQRIQREIIEPFSESRDVYEKFGVGGERGILFYGPPGTGKTHISTCIAGELRVNYADVSASELISQKVGGGVENIQRLFREAYENQPALIFLDELDAIGKTRDSNSMHESQERMVTALIKALSKIDESVDILVIGATTRADVLDGALTRTGRFDRKIRIPKPDGESRWAIFKHHLTGPNGPIPKDEFIQRSKGLSASDLVAVQQKAGWRAAHREKQLPDTRVVATDVYRAINEVKREKSHTSRFITSPPETTFDDVVGMEDLKETLKSKIIQNVQTPDVYEEFDVHTTHGFLLYGPSGTGKTHISKALAGELDINYINADTGDLVSKWVGEASENVQHMFREARNNQPVLMFIDEIDALASDRQASNAQTKSERQMVNQFLKELSDVHDRGDDVYVISATNTPNQVDPAMLQAKRLGEQIEVPAPDAETRLGLFKHYTRNAPKTDIDDDWIVEQSEGMVSSDMEQLANEAALIAVRRIQTGNGGPEKITQRDVEQAFNTLNKNSLG